MLEKHRGEGVSRILFPLPPADREQVLPRLDRVVELIRQFEGR
jgi:hypothetical protein